MPLFHNQLSNMYYIAYKAFLFYLFSSGAHKQIFLLVDSHLLAPDGRNVHAGSRTFLVHLFFRSSDQGCQLKFVV